MLVLGEEERVGARNVRRRKENEIQAARKYKVIILLLV